MTISRSIILIFFLFCNITYAQQIKIQFTRDNKLKINEFYYVQKSNHPRKILKKLNFLSSKIILQKDTLKLILVDYNSNSEYTDFYLKESIDRLQGLQGFDSFLITSIHNKELSIHKSNIIPLREQTFFTINGHYYSITDIKKITKFKYSAVLTQENSNIALKAQNFITQLPDIAIFRTKQQDNYIYINLIAEDNSFFHFSKEFKKLKFLKRKYKNLSIINILIKEDLSSFNYATKKFTINKKQFTIIDSEDKSMLEKLGFNNGFKNGYLFNPKGKLVVSSLNYNSLKRYLFLHSKKGIIIY